LGIGLVGYAVFAFDENTPFPGMYALVPTVGTALVIIFSSKDTLSGKLLGARIPVGIGLVSYSAYLWHQPLFVFARYRSLHEPTTTVYIVLSLLSLLLAFFSWKYVEAPFRKRGVFSRKQIFLFTAMGSAIFIAFGLAGHFTQGFEKAWKKMNPEKVTTYELLSEARKQSAVLHEYNRLNNNDCVLSLINLDGRSGSKILECAKKYGKGIAIIGDSHATNLVTSIYYHNKDKLKFLIGITKNGCHLPTDNPGCPYDEFRNFIKSHPDVFSVVIYEKAGFRMLSNKDGILSPHELQSISHLGSFNDMFPDEEVTSGVIDYLNELSRLAPVIWFGPRIEPQFGDRYLLSHECSHPVTLRDGQLETYSAIDVFVENKLLEYPQIDYLSQIKSYKFEFPEDYMSCDKLFWVDGDHYSLAGEIEFGSRFDFIQYLRDKYGTKF
ncbi:MAG: acyltransferase, partial [Gammaproteobacteria bacterium]|nr:acyltransferase [Gammaproteobacteria bacterium]